jgi:hypothetical protein
MGIPPFCKGECVGEGGEGDVNTAEKKIKDLPKGHNNFILASLKF